MEALYETWIPTSFYEGPSSTNILSIHLLSLCTYFESIVAILSSMCIVPRLVDWCITLILLVLNYLYLVTLMNFEGVLCIYICYSMRDKLNTFMLCFLYVKQTNVLQSIVIHESFVCAFSCCIIVYFLIARTLSFMLWLKYYDPSFECFANTLIKSLMVHVTSKIILSFYHLPTRGREGVKLGDVDTLQMYL